MQRESTTGTIRSDDGTVIAFDRIGQGPPVVLMPGGPADRTINAGLAEQLATRFTVFNYDRRGRGGSGDTPPYSVDREFEDLTAVLREVGEPAAMVGNSGTGNIELEAVAWGCPIARLALWEPPFVADGSRPPVPGDWGRTVDEMVSAGRPGDALEYWMTSVVGVPAEVVGPMRSSPFWAAMEPHAHMLVRDAALLGDFSLPAERLAAVTTPTLLLEGGSMPWVSHGVRRLAEILPDARLRSLPGQPHGIPPEALVPALADFLAE